MVHNLDVINWGVEWGVMLWIIIIAGFCHNAPFTAERDFHKFKWQFHVN